MLHMVWSLFVLNLTIRNYKVCGTKDCGRKLQVPECSWAGVDPSSAKYVVDACGLCASWISPQPRVTLSHAQLISRRGEMAAALSRALKLPGKMRYTSSTRTDERASRLLMYWRYATDPFGISSLYMHLIHFMHRFDNHVYQLFCASLDYRDNSFQGII